ncbi:MAG: hypothetical protein ACRDLB_06890 [Actinomycetota bacterium]
MSVVPIASAERSDIPLPRVSRAELKAHFKRSLESLDPIAARALRRAEALGDDKIYAQHAVPDLDGDRVKDILLYEYTLTRDPSGSTFFPSGRLSLTVMSGDTGGTLWARDWDFIDGWAGVGPFRVGEQGENGLFVSVLTASSGAWTYSFEALAGSGEQQWTKLFPSTFNIYTGLGLFLPGRVATDWLIAFERFDGLRGPATDLLVGRADYVATAGEMIVRSRVGVIDGADGKMQDQAEKISTTKIPAISDTDDLNGDGLDDYSIVDRKSGDWKIVARSGRSGKRIWNWTGRLGYGAGAWRGPDLNDDGIGELELEYVRRNDMFGFLDGASGRLLFTARGNFPYVAGDIDRDGEADIGAFDWYRRENVTGTRQFAIDWRSGKRLYSAVYFPELRGCERGCFSVTFLLDAGDVNRDGVRDTLWDQSVLGDSGRVGGPSRVRFTTSGRNGLRIGGGSLVPVRGSFDGIGDDSAEVIRKRRSLTVEAHDGVTDRVLWRATFKADRKTKLADTFAPYDTAVELTGDRCDDLMLTLRRQGTIAFYLIDGGSGRLVWTRRFGGAGGLGGSVAVRAEKAARPTPVC